MPTFLAEVSVQVSCVGMVHIRHIEYAAINKCTALPHVLIGGLIPIFMTVMDGSERNICAF